MPPKPPTDPNRRALASIDALHDAPPGGLNAEVRRLQRFVRVRRILYYSVMYPFGLASRLHHLVVPGTAVIALSTLLIVGPNPDVPLAARLLIAYWAVGGLAYVAISIRMSRLLDQAAESVGLEPALVLEAWAAAQKAE